MPQSSLYKMRAVLFFLFPKRYSYRMTPMNEGTQSSNKVALIVLAVFLAVLAWSLFAPPMLAIQDTVRRGDLDWREKTLRLGILVLPFVIVLGGFVPWRWVLSAIYFAFIPSTFFA